MTKTITWTMNWAKPCECPFPLEFERGSCTRCGRMLAGAMGSPLDVGDGLEALWVAVELRRHELRQEAAVEGVDVDGAEYASWLKEVIESI